MSITTTKEIQYALERTGEVNIGSGAITGIPIQLAHIQRDRLIIRSRGGSLEWNGPKGRHLFEWRWDSDYTHTPADLLMQDFWMENSANDNGLIKLQGDKAPIRSTFQRIRCYAQRAYAIDANGIGDCHSIWCESMQTFGASAIRWIGNNADCMKWGWLDSWRHFGSGRLGAAFMFKNCRNLLRDNLIDDGVPTLTTVLQNVYAGPITVHDINNSGHNTIRHFWFEPWGTWDDEAPDCWGFEIRADETSGNHKPHVTVLNSISLNADGLGASTKLFHVMGGHTSNDANQLRCQLEDQFNLVDGLMLFGGKVYPVAVRPMDNNFFDSADLAQFNDVVAGSFRDRWRKSAFHMPSQTDADRVSYTSSSYESNYAAEPAQPEDA